MGPLLELTATDEKPAELIRRCGRVLATFDHRSQDSGNVSWLVETEDGTHFVKTAGLPGPPLPGGPVPYLDFEDRIRLLRNAATLARSCDHRCLARLRQVIESPLGPVLVYDRALGELIGTNSTRRTDPDSAYQRFARLPSETLLGVLDDLVDLHRTLAAVGWVACDLYDGCLLLDFTTSRLTVVDLDTYRRGPFTNTMGRMFGATRFMAPEEFELGATIDERTTVFTLARIAFHFGTRLREDPSRFCGPKALRSTLGQALHTDPGRRFSDVASFAQAWDTARTR